ncbi:MAG TPA: S9 family peptidase [Thermomicrobiales bacterium]|nr:S9 family peptidase [Thermomicrobiales bacterium]
MTENPIKAKAIVDRLVPSAPVISRDGRFVAFQVGPVGYKGEHSKRSIWLSRDGQPAKQFTAGMALDANPALSPDGTRLAFLSNRNDKEKRQIFLMSLEGGEAAPLGKLEGELDNLKWSPDGAELSVLRRQPESKQRKKRNKKQDDAVVVDGEPRYNRLVILDAESGKKREVESGEREVWDYVWSSDGSQLAYVTAEEVGEDAPMRRGDVWLVDIQGKDPRHLTQLDQTPIYPVFVTGPKGPALAVRKSGFREHPAESVFLIDLETGDAVNLLEALAANVESIAPLDGIDGAIAVATAEGVHSNLYRFDVASGERTTLLPGSLTGNGAFPYAPSVTPKGDAVALQWSDSDTPEEIYLVRDAGEPVKLTDFGKDWAGKLRTSEVVSWTSDDLEIFGLLTLPERADDAPLPLVVQIHGGPSWQWQDNCFLDWHDWTQYLVSRGFAVLTPNPRGSTGRGSEFQRRLIDDVGGGEMRDVIAGAQAMVDRGIADPERLGVGGWSWGGYLTAYTVTRTQMFKAAVMGAGLSNMISDHGTDDIPSANLYYYPGQPYHHLDVYWESSAIKHVTNCVTPTLIVHGESDERVHITQGAEMYRALKTLEVPVEFVRYPREPHGFKERNHQIDLLKRIGKWYEKWLMPEVETEP